MADRIRRALPHEAPALTALAHRSKAHWRYDPQMLERFVEEIAVTPDEVEEDEVWVLEDAAGRVTGFCRLVAGDPAVLHDLWVEPEAIGRGVGRRLWDAAVDRARSGGATAMELDADPNAAGFYERMGARQVGETPSSIIPGRSLPRMRVDLD